MRRSCDGNQIWPFYSFQENLIHLQHRKCSLCRFCFSKAGKQEYSRGRTKAILADFPAQLNPGRTGKPWENLETPSRIRRFQETCPQGTGTGRSGLGSSRKSLRCGISVLPLPAWAEAGRSEVRDCFKRGSQSPSSACSAHKGQGPGSRAKEIVWDLSRWWTWQTVPYIASAAKWIREGARERRQGAGPISAVLFLQLMQLASGGCTWLSDSATSTLQRPLAVLSKGFAIYW